MAGSRSSGAVMRTAKVPRPHDHFSVNPKTIHSLQQQQFDNWPDSAFKDDDITYKDNIKIYRCSCKGFGHIVGISPSFKLWLVKDIAGILAAGFTWLLVIVGEIALFYGVLIHFHNPVYSTINGLVNITMAAFSIVAHLRCMFMDPGAVPRGNATRENIMNLGLQEGEVVYKCPKCVSIKPERAHHCSVCRRCIKKMDHHCPWINNCVGMNNQKFFVLFTMYICLISCHALYISTHHFLTCFNSDWRDCVSHSPSTFTLICVVFLLFESLLFGIFTAVMFATQLSAICSDQTGIEQLKQEIGPWKQYSRMQCLKNLFGQSFSYKWFSPFHPPWNYGHKEDLYFHTV